MSGEPKSESIKTKIMLGFSLIICGVLFVGFVAYKSFNLLVDSIGQISQPDKKIIMMNNVLKDLAQAEIELRESTLISDENLLERFFQYTDTITFRLDTLRELSDGNKEDLIMLDSINKLIGEKFKGTGGFVQLYNRNRDTDFYGRAIEEITSRDVASQLEDSLIVDTTASINIDSAVLVIDSIAGQEPKKERRGLFRSRRKKEADSIARAQQEAVTREQIGLVIGEINKAKEKEITSNIQPSLVTDTVTKIISNIKLEDQRSEYAITKKELEIIENNSLILKQIRALIGKMERDEQRAHRAGINTAEKTANKAILIIIATGILGTFSGIMFIYVIFNDITRRNFYRKLLDKAREKAVMEAKAKEEFLANMSHEIRTPLNAILGFSEQMNHTPLVDDQKEYLGAIQSSSTHLLATVNDVLDFSKIQANKLSIEKIPFKLINVVKEVYATLKLKADQKNIELCYNFDDSINEVLAGDPFRMKQILINLVNNGLKFTNQGYVEMKVSKLKDFKNKVIAQIEVNDTGIGIAPEKLDHIFEGFSQSDSSTTRKYGGTGLGLTISKQLVELQNGSLNVKSQLNQGSSFIIKMTFDKARDFKPIQKESEVAIDKSIFKGLKLMIIDDDNLNLQLAKIIFEKWDLSAVFLTNGKDAIEKLENDWFDLIITDIQMPDFGGMDLSKHVRGLEDKKKSEIPILAFTANVLRDDLDRYLKAGINDYLLKPFKEIHLYNKIVSMLDLKSNSEGGNNHSAYNGTSTQTDIKNNVQHALFDIEEILQFTGEKNESLLEVLESFVNSSNDSLLMMDSGLKNKKWEKVSMMAHKMLPSFQHLNVNSVVPLLKKLERMEGKANHAEIRMLVPQVIEKSEKVLKEVKKEIVVIKQLLSTRQIT